VEARADKHSLSDQQFEKLCGLVYQSTGIVLAESKRQMVYRRLMRRVRELKVESFSRYYELLEDANSNELPNFLNAITTNFTSFFRESHHFDYLKDTFLPSHVRLYGAGKRLRIWSAACSTGEEPYSLAITLCEFFGNSLQQWDCKILATDIDTNVLESGKNGVYDADRIESLPEATKKRWFKRRYTELREEVKVDDRLKRLITFKPLNLMHEWPVKGPFDAIVCRNVMIYFDKPTQAVLLAKFLRLLRPGGVLMLGHSESIAKDYRELKPDGRTTYIKISSEPGSL